MYAGGASTSRPPSEDDDSCRDGLGGRGGEVVCAGLVGEVCGGGEVGAAFKAPVGTGVTFCERKGLRELAVVAMVRTMIESNPNL